MSRVSIVIPSFNQGKFIGETVRSCLQQDYQDLEVIVQDGASSDETIGVLKQFDDPRLHWLSEPDRGVVDAVNRAFRRCTGEILAIQSSDDVYLPGAVSRAVRVFGERRDLGLAYGDVELIDEQSRVIGCDRQDQEFSLAAYLGRLIYVPQPAAFFRRECLDAVGVWREEFSYVADADFWLRIACYFPVSHFSETLGQYRYHADQRDTQKARILRDFCACVDSLLAGGKITRRERRYARMGQALARHRYTPESEWFNRTVALYEAHLWVPKMLFDSKLPKRQLLPGRDPVWKMLSQVKRRTKALLGHAS